MKATNWLRWSKRLDKGLRRTARAVDMTTSAEFRSDGGSYALLRLHDVQANKVLAVAVGVEEIPALIDRLRRIESEYQDFRESVDRQAVGVSPSTTTG